MAEHIQVYNPTSGKPYATAPTPKNSDGTINISDSSNKIATTEFVNSGYLPRTNASIKYYITDAALEDETRDKDLYINPIYVYDKNNKRAGVFKISLKADGSNYVGIGMRNKANTNNIVAALMETIDGTVVFKANGSQVLLPAGSVFAYAGNSTPERCLLCNGANVSRTTYLALFKAIGTLYGEGDGSTTFALPNLTDRFIQGSGTAGTTKSAGLPNISGTLTTGNTNFDSVLSPGIVSGNISNGALSLTYISSKYGMETSTSSAQKRIKTISIDASKSSTIYGNSSTIQPPSVTMRFYIKY